MRRVVPALASSPRATRLFGRERVFAELSEALLRGVPVTLVGPPGVGKTELALHVPSRVTCFVDLSTAREPGDVLALVAHALDVRVGREPASTLRAALAARDALLVLHRCDRAASEAAALVSALAPACPILCTSAGPIESLNEYVVVVDPLGPEGVALFEARASARGREELGRGARAAILGIVELCGGLPFAIELAAAAARSPVAIRDELELAVDPARPLPGVVGWALDDLSPSARLAAAEAAVFEGPFGLDAFESVVRLPDGQAAVDLLSSLVARGLVCRAPAPRDATLLLMHPCVRAVAIEALDDRERLEALRRHAAYHADAVDGSRADRLAAFEVALLDGRPEITGALASRLVADLLRQGALERAEAIVEAAAAVDATGLSAARARLAFAKGAPIPACEDSLVAAEIALRRDDPRTVLALLEATPLTASRTAVRALRARGDAHRRLGAPAVALGAYRGAVELAHGLATGEDDAVAAAELLVRMAGVELDLGAPDRAQPHLAEAIDVLARRGAERPWAIALATLADLLLEEADEIGVDALLLEARLHARRVGALDVLSRIDVLTAARALGVGQVEDVPTLLAAELAEPGAWGELARGLDAALRARVDDRWGAAELLPNSPASALLLGTLELAEARLARVLGRDDAPYLNAARERLTDDAPRLPEVRIARRLLQRMLDQPAPWTIRRDGAYFVHAGVEVSLARRASLRGLLASLLRKRIEAPGENLGPSDLHAAGWPGERLSSRVLEDRLHTAMQTLKDLGLRPLLVHETGWRLRAEVAIDVA